MIPKVEAAATEGMSAVTRAEATISFEAVVLLQSMIGMREVSKRRVETMVVV